MGSRRSRRPRPRTVAVGLLTCVVAVVGATVLMGSSATRVVTPTVTAGSTVTASVPPAEPVAARVAPVAAETTIAEVVGPVPYSDAPDGPVVGSLPVGGWWRDTKFLPVIARVPGWLQVRLPQRPNGLTGWIPESSAQLSSTTYGIVIDVTDHRLKLYDAGRLVLDAPAGVGTPDDPTPLGQFYLMEIGASRGAGWGPFVLATNAHSEAITSWEGSGDAFTAIHGPLGADAAIGDAGAEISHGCVRLHVADLARLAPVPLGAPVAIVAGTRPPW
ncbi:MAG: L,D-transpeptidase [Acidimicrobiales bacterium]